MRVLWAGYLSARHDFWPRPLSVDTHPTVTTCRANTGNMTQFLRFRRTLRQVRRWLGGHDERLRAVLLVVQPALPVGLKSGARGRKGWHDMIDPHVEGPSGSRHYGQWPDIVRRPAHPRRLVGVLVIGRIAAKPQAQLASAPEGSVILSLSLGAVGKLIRAPRPKVTAAERQV